MDTYRKHISHSEKAVAAIIWAFFLLAMVTQIFFNGTVLILAALFAVCGVVFSCLVFLPESYMLLEDALVLRRTMHSAFTPPAVTVRMTVCFSPVVLLLVTEPS